MTPCPLYPPGLTASEAPSTRPEASLACAPTYGSVVRSVMAVSKPARGVIGPAGFNRSGVGPASGCQVATSVAPFQLA